MALFAVAAISMAPTRTMPWIELAADISGVCSVAGTLLMTSIPTSRLSTKMVRSVSSPLDTGATFRVVVCRRLVCGPLVCGRLVRGRLVRGQRGHLRVDHPAAVGDH